MGWRLPPLNGLRAFEVAARHSSFTRAADELFVTPGAVSRQVRGLEEYFDRQLFDRNYREVVPTEAGRRYAAELFESFARIDRATRTFVGPDRQSMLRIYAPMTFNLRWLLPRLNRFHARNPGQAISVESLKRPPMDLNEAKIDVAFRLAGASPNTVAIPLFDVKLTPICSPAFLEAHPISKPRELLDVPLLRSLLRPSDWITWGEGVGVPELGAAKSQSFESSVLTYQSAIAGLGVAIAQRMLIENDLASGRLVTPFPEPVTDGAQFHVVYSATSRSDDAVASFVEWVREEASSSVDRHVAA